MTWLKRIGWAIAGAIVVVAAAVAGYVFGKRALAQAWQGEAAAAAAKSALDALDDRFEKQGMAARDAAHERAALEKKLDDATRKAEAAREAIRRGTAADVVDLAKRRPPGQR